MSSLVIYLSQGVYTDFTLIRFYFLHLSESPWSERALCQTCVNVLISPHVVWCPCRFSLIFSMQLYRGKRPFDCPVAGNAPLSRVLYPFPFQFLTTFLGCEVFHSYFLQSGAFKEVRMSGLTNKCNYPGACRIVDAYFRLNLAWWVWFYCLVFNLLAFSLDRAQMFVLTVKWS